MRAVICSRISRCETMGLPSGSSSRSRVGDFEDLPRLVLLQVPADGLGLLAPEQVEYSRPNADLAGQGGPRRGAVEADADALAVVLVAARPQEQVLDSHRRLRS